MKSSRLKYACFGDVHLGHRNTPTKHIVKNLIKYLLTEENKELDIIFIAGDLFDRLMELNEEDAHDIYYFIHTLLGYCFTNKIKLRVCLGTPSHEWGQSKTLVKINDLRHASEKCDLKYFNILDIEYIDDLNLSVLYIPDEWTDNHAKLEQEINAKLIENGLTQVDIGIFHGQFNYQTLGTGYKGFCFMEEYFLSIVKGYIHVGHYHTYSFFSRIIAQGSFDRLTHGEEEDKGYVSVTITNGNYDYKFIVNKDSYVYKTIRLNNDLDLAKLDKKIYSLPEFSHVRLSMYVDNPHNLNFAELKLRYKNYYIKKHIRNKDTEKVSVNYMLENDNMDFTSLGYSNSNILDSLYLVFKDNYQFTDRKLDKAKSYIERYREKLIT